MTDSTPLQEAIADAIYADTWTEPNPKWGEDWHHRFPRWQTNLAARIAVQYLTDHPAEVLAALGMTDLAAENERLRAQLDEAVRLLNEARVCEGLQEWDWPLCQRVDAFLASVSQEDDRDG